MSWYDEELPAGFQDADLEQAQFEAEGREYARKMRRVEALLAEGKRDEAQDLCPHSGGYWLDDARRESGVSIAAERVNDPRAGEHGVRCGDCGAVVTNLHGTVIHRD